MISSFRNRSLPRDLIVFGEVGLAGEIRPVPNGTERIIEAAFAHAMRTGKTKVTVVTKANVVKTTDGKFLDIARIVAERYPTIEWDSWYIDIMTAKLLDPHRRRDFQVQLKRLQGYKLLKRKHPNPSFLESLKMELYVLHLLTIPNF